MNEVISIDISESQISIALLKIRNGLLELEFGKTSKLSQTDLFQQLLQNPKESEAEASSSMAGSYEKQAQEYLVSTIKSTLNQLPHMPDTCILITPPMDSISFNIELPFSNAKNIRQVIDLEVQDTLPFDIDDFLIQHKEIDTSSGGINNIFVSLIPKKLINFLIVALKECGLETCLITTRSSALSGLYLLDENLAEAETLACISIDSEYIALNLKINGKITSCKDFRIANDNFTAELNELKLNINAFEKKFDVTFDKVILFGSAQHKNVLQQQLGRSVEVFDIKSYFASNINLASKTDLDNSSLQHALIASPFWPDLERRNLLTNFRTREFAFSPYLKYLIENGKKIIPQLSLTAFLGLLLVASIFLSREYKIVRLYKSINSQIVNSGLNLNLPKGSEISQLENLNANLELQLASLGSPSQLSALDILLDLTLDIRNTKKRAAGLDVAELTIGPAGIVISGTARDYSDVEKFEKELRKRRDMYCKIKRDTSSSSTRARGFKFIINLCDS